MTKLLACLVILGLLATGASAQELKATLSATRILIGEPVDLVVESTTPRVPDAWVSFDTFPHFEILRTSPIDTLRGSSTVTLRQTITLTSWDSGQWVIPSIHLGNRATAPQKLTVAFSPFDPAQDYHDIREIRDVPKEPRTVWYWYVLLGLLLAGVALLMFPPRRKGPVTETRIDEAVYKRSLRQLDALRAKAGGLSAKDYYSELVSIFRTYLALRKGIRSDAQTTEALLPQLKALLPPALDETLRQTLQDSDLVKFARYEPPEAQKETDLHTIQHALTILENH
ncbi:MAG: hypothetical protein JWP27_2312 [Flaviaesturariibacter sp.]|nr:hypothetical protein [Flaviaesturariibacter sp.]